MKKKRILALMLAAAMTAGLVTGCGSDSSDSKGGSGGSGGKVYYLNFKPEQADQWVELAKHVYTYFLL